jgi:hypothetical protein
MATLGGHVTVEDFANISAGSGVHQFCRVGSHAFIGGYSVITKDALPYARTVGSRPARIFGINTVQIGVSGRQISTAGTLGGGVLVSAYADWIDGVIASNPSVPATGEVPLPAWLYGALAALFLVRLRSVRSSGSAHS